MEETLVNTLIDFAVVTGISGEGMAAIIGTFLLVMAFMGLVAIGKIFFGVMDRFGYNFSEIKSGAQNNYWDNMSMAPMDTFLNTNVNHNSKSGSLFDE